MTEGRCSDRVETRDKHEVSRTLKCERNVQYLLPGCSCQAHLGGWDIRPRAAAASRSAAAATLAALTISCKCRTSEPCEGDVLARLCTPSTPQAELPEYLRDGAPELPSHPSEQWQQARRTFCHTFAVQVIGTGACSAKMVQ